MYQDKFVVVVKNDGKILREDKNLVTLPFGCEYSLFFKNLNSQRAAVKVQIDGQDVLNGNELVVDANRTLELERFVDDLKTGNHFKFIQKTEKIQEYRGDRIDDGIIRISFRFEKKPEFCQPSYYSTMDWYDPRYMGKGIYNQSVNTNIMSTSSVSHSAIPTTDEGITVMGSKSEQIFNQVTLGALEDEEHVVVLKLQGVVGGNEVTQPIAVTTKLKCDVCGTISKSNAKFCGECGAALVRF